MVQITSLLIGLLVNLWLLWLAVAAPEGDGGGSWERIKLRFIQLSFGDYG